MRIRSLKPEFWVHPVMARLPAETRLMAIALISWSDDHGYFEADARAIRGAVMPFRDSLKTIDRDLQRLVEVGFIEIRLTAAHGRVGRLPKWRDHQKVDHPKDSSLLEHFNHPDSRDSFASASRIAREASGEEGKGREGKGGDLGREGSGGEGKAPPPKASRKKAPVQVPLIAPPPAAPKAPSRIGKLHASFLELREARYTLPAPEGLDLGPVPPDEPPDWGRSAGALAQWLKRWPDDSEEQQDQRIEAVMLEWLDTPYWASPKPNKHTGKSIPFPWGAFCDEEQFAKACAKAFPEEAAA